MVVWLLLVVADCLRYWFNGVVMVVCLRILLCFVGCSCGECCLDVFVGGCLLSGYCSCLRI